MSNTDFDSRRLGDADAGPGIDTTEHMWDPGTPDAKKAGCLCTPASAFPVLGVLYAEKCPLHVVTWAMRRREQFERCPDCDCDPEACDCPANERHEGRVAS